MSDLKNNSSRFENSARNVFFSLVSQVLSMFLDILCRRVFLQYLAIEYLGLSTTFSSVLNLLSFVEMGIGSAIIFSLYEPIKNEDEGKIKSLMKLYKKVYFIVGFFVLVIGSALTPFLSLFVKELPDIPYISVVYLLLVFQTGSQYFFSYKISFLNATQQNHVFRKIQIIFNLLKAVFQILSIVIFKNYFIYLGIAIFFTLVVDIFCSIHVNKKYPFLKGRADKLEKENLKKIQKNVFALFLYKLSGTLSTTIDSILISRMLGVIPASIYANYHLIITYSDSFFNNVLGTLTPSIGNFMVNKDTQKKKKFFSTLQTVYFWISIFLAAGMIVCFNPFISVVFGSEFLFSQSVVVALVVSVTLTNFQRPCSLMRDANGLFWHGKLRPLFMSLINIGASIILTHWFGIIGVVLGTVIAKISTFVWYDPYIVYKFVLGKGLKQYFADYVEKWIILFLITFFCVCVCKNLPLTGWWLIIVDALIVTVVSNCVFYFYVKDKEEFSNIKNYLSSFIKKFKKRKKAN